MIVEGLLTVVFGLISGIIAAVNALVPPVPGFVSDGLSALSGVWGWIAGFETWLPISMGLFCLASVGACYLIGLVIGVVRVVASYLTLGGGAT